VRNGPATGCRGGDRAPWPMHPWPMHPWPMHPWPLHPWHEGPRTVHPRPIGRVPVPAAESHARCSTEYPDGPLSRSDHRPSSTDFSSKTFPTNFPKAAAFATLTRSHGIIVCRSRPRPRQARPLGAARLPWRPRGDLRYSLARFRSLTLTRGAEPAGGRTVSAQGPGQQQRHDDQRPARPAAAAGQWRSDRDRRDAVGLQRDDGPRHNPLGA